MKRVSFAFLVILYFVCTHINCDVNSSYHAEKSFFKALVNETVLNALNHSNNFYNDLLSLKLEQSIISNEDRGKLCLKNVTKCNEDDSEYLETTSKIANLVFPSLPPFDLSRVRGVSRLCKQQSEKYIQDLSKFKFWALKMYDANAKIPSGILNGNVNQLGDFDMCLQANLESQNIYGQYCLASLEVQSPPSPYLAGLHMLMQSHMHFKSRLEDPGHRVPRFSSINWALCVPSACTADDVSIGLKSTVNNIIENTELEVRVEVNPNMCQSSIKKPIPTSTFIGLSVFIFVIVIILLATVYDYYAIANKNDWILSFSLRKNVNSLFSINRQPGDIEAVHGIRFLNAILLLFAHKSMALFFIPYQNRTESAEYLGRPFSVIGRAASLYTDPFIMFSGALTTYSLLGKLQRTQKINIFDQYASRLLRILPTFAALIAFCTFIMPWLSSGPMWNLVVTHYSDICKQYWWRNLMFIHNYYGFKDMCLTHTHHVGIDTQLFFASPFLIYIIWKWPKKGSIALTLLAIISTIMRYSQTYSMRLSNYIHFGTSIQQLFDTADNMYILPAHRATVYIMGIFLGYILRNYKNVNLTRNQLRIGNTIALCCFSVSFFGPAFMGSIDYVYNPTHAAWYAAFAPISWCLSFAWIIFTSHLGYKGLLGRLFCLPIFTFWTKISYTVYLTQFPVFFFNVGSNRGTKHYGFFSMMLNIQEFFWVIALSIVLTLTFEMPFQNIRNVIFNRKSQQNTSTEIQQKKTL